MRMIALVLAACCCACPGPVAWARPAEVEPAAAGPAAAPAADQQDDEPAKKTPPPNRAKPRPTAMGLQAIERALAEPSRLTAGRVSPADLARDAWTRHRIPTVLDVAAFTDAGMPPEQPALAVPEGRAPLGATLDKALDDKTGLTWLIDDDVLVITTRDRSSPETVVYRIVRPLAADRLLRDITTAIDPGGWSAAGGTGEIRMWRNGAVVIMQSPAVQRQIAATYGRVLSRVAPPASGNPLPGTAKAGPRTTACGYEARPLDQVCAELSRTFGIAIRLDADALQQAGMAIDTPITFSLEAASPAATLSWLLRSAGLTWVPEAKGVRVTTPETAAAMQHAATYDVRDLVAAANGDTDGLMDIIQCVVEPSSWSDVGGPGTIAPGPRGLEVEQNHAVHRGIENVLSGLRQTLRQ